MNKDLIHTKLTKGSYLRLDKMTSRVKSIIVSKLDVTNNKTSTRCSVLEKHIFHQISILTYMGIQHNNHSSKKIKYLCTSMKDSAPKIMSSCP